MAVWDEFGSGLNPAPVFPNLSKPLLKGETSDVSHLSLTLSCKERERIVSPVGEIQRGWGDKEGLGDF